MKISFLSLIFCTLLAYEGENPNFKTQNSPISELETESRSLLADELEGTWIVKEILINGKPDLENFPVNSDELTLNADQSVISFDKTYKLEEKGTWKRLSKSQFSIKTLEETVVFEILELTSTELSSKMVTDEIDMVINYTRKE